MGQEGSGAQKKKKQKGIEDLGQAVNRTLDLSYPKGESYH